MRALRFLRAFVYGLVFVTAASLTEAADHFNPAKAKIIDSNNSSILTLVYIHGVFHGSWAFEELQPRLELDGRAHALVDLRGHYGQKRLSAESRVGYEEYVDDVIGILDKIDGNKILIGHSLGGLLSISVSDRNDVLGIALLAVPLPEVLNAGRWRLLLKEPLLSMGMVFHQDPSILYHNADFARHYLIGESTPDLQFEETLRQIQKQQEPYQLFEDLQLLELDLAGIRKPALIIYGTEDPTVDEDAAGLLASPLGTKARPIDGAPHGVMFMPGHAQVVADTINRWIGDLEASSGLVATGRNDSETSSSNWLSGPPVKHIPPCREPFFHYLLNESGLEKSEEGSIYGQLARDRIANLTNRIVSGWHDHGMRRFKGKLTYLIVNTSSGAPAHFDFDFSRSQIEPWIREEELCRSKI